jgi:hypothetical protein
MFDRIKAQSWFLFRVSVVVAFLLVAKTITHYLGWEVISVNALFSGIIAANVFLMGFLLSGVLTDYKEAERLPGEFAACLENLAQEIRGAGVGKPEVGVGSALAAVSRLADGLIEWFYKRIDTGRLMAQLDELTVEFARLEPRTQVAYIGRFRQEQSNFRRSVIRVETIRETSFVAAGYLLVDTITLLLCIGLVLTSLDPFYESLFTSGVIAFLLIFLLTLIRDLDNPFGYYERFSGADVSLSPLRHAAIRLARLAGVRKGQRYKTGEEMEVLYVTRWKTPFSGGGKGRLPAGTVLTVAEDPAPGATVVACDPDKAKELEPAMVPESERSDERYDGFSLSIDLDTLRDRCELAV